MFGVRRQALGLAFERDEGFVWVFEVEVGPPDRLFAGGRVHPVDVGALDGDATHARFADEDEFFFAAFEGDAAEEADVVASSLGLK